MCVCCHILSLDLCFYVVFGGDFMWLRQREGESTSRKFIHPADPEFNTFKGVNPICEHNFIDLRIFLCSFPFYDFWSRNQGKPFLSLLLNTDSQLCNPWNKFFSSIYQIHFDIFFVSVICIIITNNLFIRLLRKSFPSANFYSTII